MLIVWAGSRHMHMYHMYDQLHPIDCTSLVSLPYQTHRLAYVLKCSCTPETNSTGMHFEIHIFCALEIGEQSTCIHCTRPGSPKCVMCDVFEFNGQLLEYHCPSHVL
eukprot:jgi/Botrbrau1/9749/Bobra.0388s0036.1